MSFMCAQLFSPFLFINVFMLLLYLNSNHTLWSIGEKNASNSEDIRKWISEVKTINNMNTCEIRGGEEIIVLKEN